MSCKSNRHRWFSEHRWIQTAAQLQLFRRERDEQDHRPGDFSQDEDARRDGIVEEHLGNSNVYFYLHVNYFLNR